MKISVIVLCVLLNVAAQTESLEKRAITIAQQAPVSNLDAQLSDLPFVDWFNELVGRDAGIVWQLAECGADSKFGSGQVIEATAISGRPALRSAAVDAAREWVYKPATLNGIPTKVETVLTFTFAHGSQ